MLFQLVRPFIFSGALVISFVVSGCQMSGGNNQVSEAGNRSGAQQQEIREELEQYTQALLNKDLTALDRIWADDLTFVNLYGELLSKQNRMENIKSDATTFKSIQLSDVNIRSYGQAAVANFQVALDAHYSGEKSSGNYQVTTVWAKEKDAWQLVAIHMTEIL